MINGGNGDDDAAKNGQRVASRRTSSGLRGLLPPLREKPKATSLGGRQHGAPCTVAGEKGTRRPLAEQRAIRTLFLFPDHYKSQLGSAVVQKGEGVATASAVRPSSCPNLFQSPSSLWNDIATADEQLLEPSSANLHSAVAQ